MIRVGYVVRLPATLSLIAAFVVWDACAAIAEDSLTEDFKIQPETRWRSIADTVMGAVSTGQVNFIQENRDVHAHMTGRVSTENNGGFIQIRVELPTPPSAETAGVRLAVRGNEQRYFVHLRTSGTILPWQYYQVGFTVTEEWSGVRLPFTAFEASGQQSFRTFQLVEQFFCALSKSSTGTPASLLWEMTGSQFIDSPARIII